MYKFQVNAIIDQVVGFLRSKTVGNWVRGWTIFGNSCSVVLCLVQTKD